MTRNETTLIHAIIKDCFVDPGVISPEHVKLAVALKNFGLRPNEIYDEIFEVSYKQAASSFAVWFDFNKAQLKELRLALGITKF